MAGPLLNNITNGRGRGLVNRWLARDPFLILRSYEGGWWSKTSLTNVLAQAAADHLAMLERVRPKLGHELDVFGVGGGADQQDITAQTSEEI